MCATFAVRTSLSDYTDYECRYLRQPLGIANKHVGYVYLVDPKLKVRWAGCADPKSEEIAALKTCTTVLLDRISKQQDPSLPNASATPQEQPSS